MQNLQTKINLLVFSLKKKIEKLEIIKEYTQKQQNRQAYSLQVAEAWLLAKQEAIAEIQRLDQGFQTLVQEIMPYLSEEVGTYRQGIGQMQVYIRKIEDLALQIQQMEAENYRSKLFINHQAGPSPNRGKTSKYKAAREYKKTAGPKTKPK